MGKNKKKGTKMPARVEAKNVPTQTPKAHMCAHWNTKKNCCKLGTVCSNEDNCRAFHY